MAISGDGDNVYVAAAVSNALGVFARDPSTGALTQATDGTGCIAAAPLTGCTTGVAARRRERRRGQPRRRRRLRHVAAEQQRHVLHAHVGDRAAHAEDRHVRPASIYLLAVGCSLGRALSAPEGLAVSPDGADVYVAAFTSGAIDDLRSATPDSGALIQKPRRPGCLHRAAPPGTACRAARLLGASSVAVSPDGAYVYSAAFQSNAVGVFKRVTRVSVTGEERT